MISRSMMERVAHTHILSFKMLLWLNTGRQEVVGSKAFPESYRRGFILVY